MEFYGDDVATTTVLVTLKTAVGLFGIWLGCSSLGWFWRGAIALGVTALLIPPRAYDPALGVLVQIAVVAGVIGIAKRWRRRQEFGGFFHWRFQLMDLFRTIFLLSLGLALILFLARQPRLCEAWWLCLESALQAGVTLLIAAIVMIPMRWFWRGSLVVPLVMCWIAVSLVEYRVTIGEEKWEVYVPVAELLWPAFFVRNGLLVFSQLLMLAAFLIGVSRLQTTSLGGLRRTARIVARILLVGYGTVAATLIPFLWWELTFLPTPPQLVLPKPNGYDFVGNAAKLIQGDAGIDPDAVTTAELASFVHANQHVIELAREASEQLWQRPLTFAEGTDTTYLDLGDLRDLFRTLNLSVCLAMQEQRMDDAVNDAIVSLRFGSRVRNGGLFIDYLIGTGFESIVVETLKPMRANLNATQCRRSFIALQAVDGEHLPLAQIKALDRIWSLHEYGYQYALMDKIRVQIRRQTSSGPFDARADDASLRLLMVELAIRAFRLEQGQFPESLDELTPGYFSVLPADPFTQGSFIYHRNKSGDFALYSAGPDGDDDGGMSMSWQAANLLLNRKARNGDFFLDFWNENFPASKPANAATDNENE